MAYAPLTKIPQQFFNNLGNPLVGGTISAFLAGTSTPTNMFSDNAGTVAGTTVTLDSRGEPTTFKLIWLNTAVIYKFVLKDNTGTTIWTIDNISGDDGTGNTASSVFDQQTLTATAGQTVFNLGYEYVTGTNAMAVYKNGSRLITSTDFTETSSTSVTLTMAAIAGDEYTFIGGQDVSSSFSGTNVSFIQSGTGAITRSVQTKLREIVSVKDFGAVGDGVTDDTAAIQAALNALTPYDVLVFNDATEFKISSQLTLAVNNVTIMGNAKIKAANSTNFEYMFDAQNLTGVKILGLEFDANKVGRGTGQSVRFCGVNVSGSTDCQLDITVRNTLGYSGVSAVAVAASGGCLRFRGRFKFSDLGTSATVLPSDGVFHRGTGALISGIIANGVTDNVAVLEGSSYSRIEGIVATDCTSIASITNDTAFGCVGNSISGVVAASNHIGSTGGIFAVACFGTGSLTNTRISDVNVVIADSATGGGPCVHVYKTSTGRVDGLNIDGLTVNRGVSVGRLAQAVLVQGSDNVTISNLTATLETGGGTTGVKVDGNSVNAIIEGGSIIGGTNGVVGDGTAVVRVQGVTLKNQGQYGIYADSASVVTEQDCRISGFGTYAVGEGVSATLRSQYPRDWTPIYSSNIGNAAATFTGTPTTALARISYLTDNMVAVTINFSSVLNAVTPAYLEFTLPLESNPLTSSMWTPCSIYNSTAWETGFARTINGSASVRVYRANQALFSSGAPVEARVSFVFECVNA